MVGRTGGRVLRDRAVAPISVRTGRHRSVSSARRSAECRGFATLYRQLVTGVRVGSCMGDRLRLGQMCSRASSLVATLSLLSGCTAGIAREEPAVLRFFCDYGRSFSVMAWEGRARVVTSAGAYELERRRSSIGRSYSSEVVAFIQDGDRAVLIGAAGGPFDGCSLLGASRKGQGADTRVAASFAQWRAKTRSPAGPKAITS